MTSTKPDQQHAADDSENGEDDEEDDDDEDDDDDEEDDDDDEEDDDDHNGDVIDDDHTSKEDKPETAMIDKRPTVKSNDVESPLNGAAENITTNSNEKSSSSPTPPASSSPTGNSFEMKPSSLSAIGSTLGKASTAVKESSHQSSPNSSTTAMTSSSVTSDKATPEPNTSETPAAAAASEQPPKPKKKSVTFHTTLETTDENIVKKVYNPSTVPLTPIIKKECLARPIRLKKSFNRKMKKRLQRLAMQAAAASSKSECILRPSLLSGVVQKSTEQTTSSFSAGSAGSLAASGEALAASAAATAATTPAPPSSTASQETGSNSNSGGESSEARNLESGGTQFGDKRFILPKRSAHSSRVIKPNKRFLDEFELEIKKKNKAAAAAAAASGSSSTGDSNSGGGKSSGNDSSSDKVSKSDAKVGNTEDSAKVGGEEEHGDKNEEGKKKREQVKKDVEELQRRISKSDAKDVPESPKENGDQPPRPPSSINNPFAKNSLLDASLSPLNANGSSLKLVKPSALSSTSPSSSLLSNAASSSLASASSIFGKSILRQPRLQFTTSLLNSNPLATPGGASSGTSLAPSSSLVPSAVSEGPFSLHLKPGAKLDSSKIFSSALNAAAAPSTPVVTPTASVPNCSICGIASNTRYYQQASKKFGVGCCDVCRKFISKMIKKLASSSSPTSSSHATMKCKNEGKCSIGPPLATTRTDHIKTRHISKERCHACWLKKCLGSFQLPPVLKIRLTQTLPLNMRQVETNNSNSHSAKKEPVENNIFSNSLVSGQNPAGSRILWHAGSMDKPEFAKSNSFLSLTNPLVQNNTTFGSSPPIKLNTTEKPSILAPSALGSPKGNKSPSVQKEEAVPATKEKKEEDLSKLSDTSSKTVKTRSKLETAVVTTTASDSPVSIAITTAVATTPVVTSSVTTTTAATSTTTTTTPTAAASPANGQDKRQRIDLKGPRVKHVCRSASIVLGQPLATFPEDATTLENIETPPSESVADMVEDNLATTNLETPVEQELPNPVDPILSCAECKEPDDLALSPPATPADMDTSGSTEKDLVIDEDQLPESISSTPTKEVEIAKPPPTPPPTVVKVEVVEVSREKEVPTARKIEEIERPTTRKATSSIRPQILKQNINAITKSFNTNIRAAGGQQAAPEIPSVPLISIDFWENYDPAEVSRTGFGLILSEEIPIKALCFLCGSSGLDELLFCVCCCEPYHQYCVKDEYNIRQVSLDDTNVSLLELTSTTMNAGSSPQQQALNRFNWMCPRCTVCYTCNMATGSKVKCQKCGKNYHTTCLGTSKRLLGADRPLICAACLKCKSCSTTNVTKFIGNLPMCTPCFRLRQKGNFCPLCQRCYEDNDFDLKMMECGDCKRWVHAKCEGLTDEQYNMLSALPENIEFICKKCGKNNECANVWRDAVAAEFKAGLLSVVKLLSKSRQACALLKLSPRKKTNNCTCSISTGKSISFYGFGNKDEGNMITKKAKLDEDSIYDFNSENSSSNSSFPPTTKCYCSVRPSRPSDISLVEIKQKINANEYYSLQDFNYDMNSLVNSIGSDELSTAYKEFLSETFPWFQNETKACTDALEEAMCGEEMGDYSHVAGMVVEPDQRVPSIDIPLDEIDDYFYESPDIKDNRICMFCKQLGEGLPLHESRLLYCGQNNWAHTNCALWSAEVFEEIDGSLQNVHSAASRGRLIKCSHCNVKGATVGCNVKNCGEHYHFPCAKQANCTFMQDKTVYCPQHTSEASRKKCQAEKNFEINRSVYVELDRRKKKFVEPSKVQFMIGSLSVKKLGHIVPMFSDHSDAIIPTDFECTRLYWSSKEPWKIVEYKIKTTIQNNNYCHGTDFGRNFTVDHTLNSSAVSWGLTQISKWHSSLNNDDQEAEPMPSTSGFQREKTMKQLLEAVGGPGDDTNDEEPQNNNDLLPQEIKDAIFEDIPHDILDGISMLDILPKLMTYDDLIAMDLKNENNFNAEILKEVGGVSSSGSSSNSSNATGGSKDDDMEVDEDDINEAIMKCSGELSNDGWMKSISQPGIEDALLSAIKQPSSSRDLKRSKSDILSRAVVGGRVAGQRSGSFSWNSKLESTAAVVAKRRKISKLADVLSLGRIKDEPSGSMLERRKSLPNEEFTWSATKKSAGECLSEGMNVFEKLKISQLDGMDDFCGDSVDMKIYSSNMIEAPVKCDRCHATYRNQESYQRHLNSCEVLSTSESDSETRSPRLLSPEQQQAQVTNQFGAGTFILPQTSSAQTITTDMYGNINQNQATNPTISVISGLNNQTINLNNLNNQAIISNIPASMPITINQLPSGIPIQTSAGTQQIPIQGTLSNLGGNMIISNQGQIFAQPVNFQQSLDNQQGFVQNKQRFIQPAPANQLPQTISIGNNLVNTGNTINMLPQQQQIISIGPNGQPQILTVTAPQHQQQQTSLIQNTPKKQMMFPTVSPKKQVISKISHGPTPIKAKKANPTSTVTSSKNTIHIKKQEPIAIQQAPTPQPQHIQTIAQPVSAQQQQQIQLINTSYPLIRPASAATPQQATTTSGNPIIFQQPNQPIIVQQVGGNQISYVADQNPVQYLAPTNVLTQNGFAMTTAGDGTLAAATNNILIPNGAGGYSMIPASALQLAAPQPQVIGTIIQPQATTIQCGMMSTEQMVLGAAATPTLEMVTDPTSGCMYLTSPPVYYGLETIVQNTVMSSQQFVSTAAMQGVLSQNSSFSATTTQVFQASKIEPIVEVPTGYVVLNNDGTTTQQSLAPMQLQTSSGLIQQAQIQPSPVTTLAPQTQQLQATVTTSQPTPIQAWKIEPQATVVQQQQPPPAQTTIMNPIKSTTTVKNIIPKSQSQLVNKVMPNTLIKSSPDQVSTSMGLHKINLQSAASGAVYTTTATMTTTTKVSNVIKPITKTINQNKPKIVAKPVKQKSLLLSPPHTPTLQSLQLNQQQTVQHVQQFNLPVSVSSQPQMVPVKPSINSEMISQPITSTTSKIATSQMKNTIDFIPTGQPVKSNSDRNSLLKKPETKPFSRNVSSTTFPASQQQQQQSIQINAIPTAVYNHDIQHHQQQKSLHPQIDNKKKPSQITMSIATTSSSPVSSIPGSVSMSNSSITITPTQTASITLPMAPYPMPLYSNIPTNVVNPIQQSVNNSNSNTNTATGTVQNRPTNRVLPMQATAILPKSPEVPQTPPPLKIPNALPDKIDEISIIPSHTFSPEPPPTLNQSPGLKIGSEKQLKEPRLEIEIKPIEIGQVLPPSEDRRFNALDTPPPLTTEEPPTFQLSLNIDQNGSLIPMSTVDAMDTVTSSTSPSFAPTIAEIEIKPVLQTPEPMVTTTTQLEMDAKCEQLLTETEEMLAETMQEDPLDVRSVDSSSMNDESESPEIKNKISEILDNLEQQTNEEDGFSECKESDSSELLLKIEETSGLDGSSSSLKSQEEQQLVDELNQELQASAHASPAASSHVSELIIPPIFESDPKKDDDSGYDADHKENLDPVTNMSSRPPSSNSNLLTGSESHSEELVKQKSGPLMSIRPPKTNSPKLLYEIQSQDGFTYKSTSIVEIWDKLFEAVQTARKAHGLQPLPEGQLEEMAGVQMLGLKTNAIRYLLEQLPGVEKCSQYQPQYHKKLSADGSSNGTAPVASIYADYFDDIKENPYGAARCEPYSSRSEYDMFSWLASRHRKQPMPVVAQSIDDTVIPRRGSGSNLPMAMRYRTLKETSKESVGVYRSHIHGRGLFCNRDIEAGEMVIEYAGELIRSTLTDKRERYYDGRGIGCYMFKIDEHFVVDATMRGNAARFINHSCEPNCYSKVVDILGHKHIIIFALRRIVQGEELTYDYKFPFEDVKIPCSCGSKKCRKYLN
ncbi:histone-lysine N-methyltransferase trithorax isoform X2 [Aedes albopictus]|uniref:Histone-lysine N-methyltransferase n=1 Tax=Aedes albopictus TaxID=7160 RepID=A0ABM1ZPT9_AEDAL